MCFAENRSRDTSRPWYRFFVRLHLRKSCKFFSPDEQSQWPTYRYKTTSAAKQKKTKSRDDCLGEGVTSFRTFFFPKSGNLYRRTRPSTLKRKFKKKFRQLFSVKASPTRNGFGKNIYITLSQARVSGVKIASTQCWLVSSGWLGIRGFLVLQRREMSIAF